MVVVVFTCFIIFSLWTVRRLWQLYVSELTMPQITTDFSTPSPAATYTSSSPAIGDTLGPFDIMSAKDGTNIDYIFERIAESMNVNS
jgi:hypothetical protein